MTDTLTNTNDFQSLFRVLKFKELLEKGMSLRLDLSDKLGQDLPNGKMILKSELSDLHSFVEHENSTVCHKISSQDRYRLVLEIESFQSIENKGVSIKKGNYDHGLGIEVKIELVE